ncbi:MAG TPA: DegT/DnrJ/EryC1/StrS family aminotransferase, partial [Candidatus Angelobacter sp.]
IARLGAKPVFVDIHPETFNLDPQKLERAITSRTRAIMPVHLFGLTAEMDPILAIAADRKLPVIEDAAQAIGSSYHGRIAGAMGDFGCFSFFPSKNLGGAGDGGLITTNDPSFAERLKLLHLHGSPSKYEYAILGMNSRLDALQAAVLRVKLRYVEQWTEGRIGNAGRYRALFAASACAEEITVPGTPPHCRHVYNQFVIRAKRRDALRKHLQGAGIPSEIYYPHPLHLQPAFAFLGYKQGDFPETERACQEVLALPVFPELTAQQQDLVVKACEEFYTQQATSPAAAGKDNGR